MKRVAVFILAICAMALGAAYLLTHRYSIEILRGNPWIVMRVDRLSGRTVALVEATRWVEIEEPEVRKRMDALIESIVRDGAASDQAPASR